MLYLHLQRLPALLLPLTVVSRLHSVSARQAMPTALPIVQTGHPVPLNALHFPPFSKETYPCCSARRSNSSAWHKPHIFKMQTFLKCFCLFLFFYFCQVPFCINLCHALSNLKLQCTISLWKHCPCLLWLRDCAHLFCSLNALSLTSNLANTHGPSISQSHCETVFSFLAQTGLLPNVSTVCLTRYTRSALKTGTLVCPSYTSLYTDIIPHIRWTLGNVYIYIDVC